MTYDVLKEWWYYLFQCTECRRCSLFCPYGIDTAEITIIGRELLNLLGLNIDWIATPVANCYRTGNHLGIQPHAFKDMLDFFCEDIEDITGIRPEPSFNRKGAEILFITPSGDVFADPGTYTCMGYLMLFHFLKEKYGFDYTWSTYASEGGNFGFFTSHEMMKRLNAKMYMEAERTKMVHISEFLADLIYHDKLDLDKSRNDHLTVSFHDSCNTSRGMGMFDEPRYVIQNVCNNFYDMPSNTIREQTFCCGSGSGLNAGEDMELRLAGGLPRANAVRHVHEKHGVNMLACVCAIDRAVLPALMQYWVPEVDVTGVTELVGNALNLPGQKKRTTDLRGEDLPGMEDEGDADE